MLLRNGSEIVKKNYLEEAPKTIILTFTYYRRILGLRWQWIYSMLPFPKINHTKTIKRRNKDKTKLGDKIMNRIK